MNGGSDHRNPGSPLRFAPEAGDGRGATTPPAALEALQKAVQAVQEAPIEALPELRGLLAQADSVALARLTQPPTNGAHGPPSPEPGGRLLTAEEMAPILGVTIKWLYRNSRKLPFAKRLSPNVLRFDEGGALEWARKREA